MVYVEPEIVKAAFAFVLMAASTALFIYGLTAAVFIVDTKSGVEVFLWELCFRSDGELKPETCIKLDKYDCEEQHDKFSSARAFVLISVFMAFSTMVFAGLEIAEHRGASKWRLMLSLMTCVTGVVAWSVCVSLFTLKQCPLFDKSINNVATTALGKGSIGIIVAWILACLTFGLELANEKRFSFCMDHNSNDRSPEIVTTRGGGGGRKKRDSGRR